jgi:hypothetical protein
MITQNKPNARAPKKSSIFGLKDISIRATEELEGVTGYDCSSVVSIHRLESEWKVLLELVEKHGIPDRMDILGLYEVVMDLQGNLTKYERKGLRKRGDTMQPEAEE